MRRDAKAQRLEILNLSPVDLQDDVSAPDPGALGRASILRIPDVHARGARQAEGHRALGNDALAIDPEPRTHQALPSACA